jgi:hypothetical protein
VFRRPVWIDVHRQPFCRVVVMAEGGAPKQAGYITLDECLASDGTIEAYLAAWLPLRTGEGAEKIDLEWCPVALVEFDADAASDILARYMTAVSSRCGLDGAQVSAFRVYARCVGEGVIIT